MEACLSHFEAQHARQWGTQADVEEYSHFEGNTSINVDPFCK